MNILKEKTKSLCPLCYKEISAQIYEESGKVYISKNCCKHGEFKYLIEKDIWIYKRLMNKDCLQERMPFNNMLIAVTHSCNLDCPICYLPNRDVLEPSLEDIKKAISNFNGKVIRLSGGEPTLREDLPEIIRFIHREDKVSVLITNGLKLIDRNYVKELRKAGLNLVCLSFNGFDDKVYEKINGRRLLRIKLKALKNIKKEKINITLSVMLVRGINENELKKIYRFCIRNCNLIYNLRIRNSTVVGKYIPSDAFCTSEILEQLSNVLGIDKYKLFNKFLNEHDHAPCRFEMNFYSLFSLGEEQIRIKNSKIRKIILAWNFLIRVGFFTGIRLLWRMVRRKEVNFHITIRCRIDSHNIDLSEIQRCPSLYLLNDGERHLPFCQALILNEDKQIL